jgi:hypothetical protein
MRNFANVAFVIVFLIIIFSQLTNVGVTNYGIKKLLPRLIIAAILVNLSYFVCQIAVDLSNILGYSLRDLLAGLVPVEHTAQGFGSTANGFGAITAAVVGGTVLYASLAALIPVLVAAVVALVMILFILVARQALIILLIVISPLAFVAFLLPNTEKLFEKWQKAFMSMLLLFPIIAVVFGMSTLASIILGNTYNDPTSGDWFGQIIASAILVLPLFIVPGLLKKSLDSIDGIGTKLSSLSDKLSKGASSKTSNSGLVKNYAAKEADRRARISTGNYAGRGGKLNPNNWRSGLNRKLNRSTKFNMITAGYGAERELAIQSQNRKDSQDAMAMFGGDDILMSAWAKSGGDLNKVPAGSLSESQKDKFQLMRNTNQHMKATSFLSAAQALSTSGDGRFEAIQKAIDFAGKTGASSIQQTETWMGARSAYRKAGRGDVAGLMDAYLLASSGAAPINESDYRTIDEGEAMEKGWGTVVSSSINRNGLKFNPEGTASYLRFLESSPDNIRAAASGFNSMEGRARELVSNLLVESANSGVLNQTNPDGTPRLRATGTGGTHTVNDIKDYFGITS